MYITTRNTQNENRAIATKHPSRAPTVVPARLLEVELELLLAEVGLVEIGLVEVLAGLVVEAGLVVDAGHGLVVGIVSHWPMIVHNIKSRCNRASIHMYR